MLHQICAIFQKIFINKFSLKTCHKNDIIYWLWLAQEHAKREKIIGNKNQFCNKNSTITTFGFSAVRKSLQSAELIAFCTTPVLTKWSVNCTLFCNLSPAHLHILNNCQMHSNLAWQITKNIPEKNRWNDPGNFQSLHLWTTNIWWMRGKMHPRTKNAKE